MTPIHIIGHAGCGKTTFIVDIIEELIKRNIKVGSMKHSTHIHELDKPGKDSFKHRKAGASPVSIITKQMAAVYLPVTDKLTPQKLLEKYYSDVDIVLIEGWLSGPYDKIEIWQKNIKQKPLFSFAENICAFVSDDALETDDSEDAKAKKIKCFKRKELSLLADFIIELFR